MFKKIFTTLIAICLISAPLTCLAIDSHYGAINVPGQVLLTGVKIEPLAISETEKWDYGYEDYWKDMGTSTFDLKWGGLSIDVLAAQIGIQGQRMAFESGCCDRQYSFYTGGSNVIDQAIHLKSPGIQIDMTQYARQGAEMSAWAGSFTFVE